MKKAYRTLITATALVITMSHSSVISAEEVADDSIIISEELEAVFPDWNEDAPALNALVDYVEVVTDAESPDFIPEADRIAGSLTPS